MKTAAISTLATFALLPATTALAQESSRADFEKFCEDFRGRWVGDVVWIADWPGQGKKGDKVTCYCEMTITEDGNALVGRMFGGSGSSTWLTVYDATKKEIRQTSVNSGGTVITHVLTKAQDGWVSKATGSNPDGSKVKGKFVLNISEGGKKHSWSGSSTTDGEPNEEAQDVWIRVSDK